MPQTINGKPVNEKAWKRAKAIVNQEYPKLGGEGDKFYALVTTIYKSVCKSPDYACESSVVYSRDMGSVLERLAVFIDDADEGQLESENDAWLSELFEEASLGKELLFKFIPQKDLYALKSGLPKELHGDLRKVMEALIDALTPKNARAPMALRRLSNMVSRGADPKSAGDELFKIADEIGVKLRR